MSVLTFFAVHKQLVERIFKLFRMLQQTFPWTVLQCVRHEWQLTRASISVEQNVANNSNSKFRIRLSCESSEKTDDFVKKKQKDIFERQK